MNLRNSSGKVLTIFLVIFAILLISLTAISIFFFQKEIERRKAAEGLLEKSRASEVKLEEELRELKKQSFLLGEKNKEADERINSLLDELDLEKGLREETKLESASLKEKLEQELKVKQSIEEQLASVKKDLEQKSIDLETNLQKEMNAKRELEAKVNDLTEQNKKIQEEMNKKKVEGQLPAAVLNGLSSTVDPEEVDLEKIVVVPDEIPDGRILSVDTETEFVIVNLGEKDGIIPGKILSVYRGNDYLGDITITRVQPEMSAADFIPPFSSRKVRKNDQVVSKKE
ncbi:MAG TPA: hypothetical protein DD723_03465 [Candidatus Omnitrophica bacterium]|nr:MAG: hypothetical protein A2Z81_00810 [Omnitrophica WOR_2 bacterium GWA2_45_18]OGX18716.1 MAG: hypothetical protein A2Y04_00935 [Omnitrophica WOR_2 bacterium GWC2_45_7]HBR14589.1 hypothetical protein [Candidatus Omnitrophota bacterium]